MLRQRNRKQGKELRLQPRRVLLGAFTESYSQRAITSDIRTSKITWCGRPIDQLRGVRRVERRVAFPSVTAEACQSDQLSSDATSRICSASRLGFGGSGLCRPLAAARKKQDFPVPPTLLSQQAQLLGQFSGLLECGSRRLGLAGQRQNARECKLRMDDDRRGNRARLPRATSAWRGLFAAARSPSGPSASGADQRRAAQETFRDMPTAIGESRSLLEATFALRRGARYPRRHAPSRQAINGICHSISFAARDAECALQHVDRPRQLPARQQQGALTIAVHQHLIEGHGRALSAMVRASLTASKPAALSPRLP